MEMDRRNFCSAAAAFATLGSLFAQAQSAGDTVPMNLSRVFKYTEMPVTNHENGGWGRAVLHGTLPTGEFIEVHETMLPAGQMPHPPHQHRNTEFLLIREGTLQFLNNGIPEPVGAGDVVYTASNQMHGLRNVGSTPARYFVVSVSHGQL